MGCGHSTCRCFGVVLDLSVFLKSTFLQHIGTHSSKEWQEKRLSEKTNWSEPSNLFPCDVQLLKALIQLIGSKVQMSIAGMAVLPFSTLQKNQRQKRSHGSGFTRSKSPVMANLSALEPLETSHKPWVNFFFPSFLHLPVQLVGSRF